MHSFRQAAMRFERARLLKRKEFAEQIRQKVVSHVNTKLFKREDFPRAFFFVEEMYPEVAHVIRDLTIYKNDNTALWAEMGLTGVAGMYVVPVSMILITYSVNIPDDVVAVHELLHCAHDKLMLAKDPMSQEDMTFRASIPYILQDHKPEWVARHYLLPYYYSIKEKGTVASRLDERDVIASCMEMIEKESGATPTRVTDSEPAMDRFDFLD